MDKTITNCENVDEGVEVTDEKLINEHNLEMNKLLKDIEDLSESFDIVSRLLNEHSDNIVLADKSIKTVSSNVNIASKELKNTEHITSKGRQIARDIALVVGGSILGLGGFVFGPIIGIGTVISGGAAGVAAVIGIEKISKNKEKSK